jgi:hypothetical protein
MDLKKLLLSEGQRTNTKKSLTKNLMEQFEDIANLKKTLSTATHFTLDNNITLEDAKTAGGNELKLFKGAKFGPGKNFKTSGYLVSNTKYQIVGSFLGSKQTNVKTGVIYYSCKTGKFMIKDQNRTWYNDKDSIELKNVQKTFTKFCGIAKQLPDMGGGNSPTTTTTTTIPSGSSTPTRQSQTPTLIKQIQKTIGVAETGKLTDTEIQTIYDKLNPSTPVNIKPEKLPYLPIGQIKSDTAPTELAGVKSEKNEGINEEINRIKEMMGIVLNEQSTPTEPQPEKTPTEKLQELLNTKFSAGLTVDGKMGPKTAQAIINALGKATVTTPTPSSTNQTSSGTPADTKPTDNTSSGTPKQKLLKTF